MALTENAAKGAEILVPLDGIGTSEITVGLLGAKVDPVRFAFGIDGKYVTEIRLLEIERRILAIEAAASGTPTRRAETLGSVGEADGGPAPKADAHD